MAWRLALISAIGGLLIGVGGTWFALRAPAPAAPATANAARPAAPLGANPGGAGTQRMAIPASSAVQEGEPLSFTVARAGVLPAETLTFSLIDEAGRPVAIERVQVPGGGRPTDVPIEFQQGQEIQQVRLEVGRDGIANEGEPIRAVLRTAGASPTDISRSPAVTIWDRPR